MTVHVGQVLDGAYSVITSRALISVLVIVINVLLIAILIVHVFLNLLLAYTI
jgi:hypothetical protein